MSNLEDGVLAAGLLPDRLLRRVILSRVKGLEMSFDRLNAQERAEREAALVAAFESGPITINADDANRQHYELPPEFFQLVLGPRCKYSCCLWPEGVVSLAEAEEAMLELTAERAGLGDGQDILDLGCGWGSLALWAAERYPRSKVLAMSNSNAQRRFIGRLREERGLKNLEVVTAEVGRFAPRERFDRVVSVEMFEHVRNHRALMERVAGWLKPEGRLFVHVFCHRRHLYAFEPDAGGGWMTRHFFSGGVMPSWDYLTRYQANLTLLDRWQIDGLHYSLTLRAWLENLDRRREQVMPLLRTTYGRDRARLWFAHWRIFFMACDETFALDSGRAYFVGHYLFSKGGSQETSRDGVESQGGY
jgi:cyclopropane-fatty-acyl-phospholipid synthase